MTLKTYKFTPDSLVQLLGDIRADYIAGEIQGTPFNPARKPLYLEYAFELLRQLLPIAAMEKAHTEEVQDHQVCNRAVRMMSQMVDKAFYERFKPQHPTMPKQLTDHEWGTYMLQMRFHGWHSGVPVYPSVDSGVNAATPLDFITEERDAMARIARLGIEVVGLDPFDIANEIKGDYPNTSLSALVLVATKAQSLKRVTHVVDTARTQSSSYVFHATVEQAEKGVDDTARTLGWLLSHSERESAIQALYLAPGIDSAA